MPDKPICGDCLDFVPSIDDFGVCDPCRSALARRKTHPACPPRRRELEALVEVERLQTEIEILHHYIDWHGFCPPRRRELEALAEVGALKKRVAELETNNERMVKELDKYITCVVCGCTLEPLELQPHCENCVPGSDDEIIHCGGAEVAMVLK